MTKSDDPTKPQPTWDPAEVAVDLSAKLSARSRHINLLMGAGTSRPAGLPDVKALLASIMADLEPDLKKLADQAFDGRHLEDGISRIRKIRALLGGGEQFGDFDPASTERLDIEIERLIVKHLSAQPTSRVAHEQLATWVVGEYYSSPIEIFTINYDLLIEEALEAQGAYYADGFVGNLSAGFRADIVEATGTTSDTYPASFARLWKLHGSLNWATNASGQIVRTGAPVGGANTAVIYPSEDKYDQSRRVPFTVLQDRFRRALAVPESLTLVTGYSFGDQHLNEVIFDSARRYPRSEVVVFCYSDLYPEPVAEQLPNVSIYGASEAMIGGECRKWADDTVATSLVFDGGKFRLGNFAALAAFLSRSSRLEQWQQYDSPSAADQGAS
jgi:hypothetical protein